MTSLGPSSSALLRLWAHLQPSRRRQFGALVVLMVLSSLAELVSIGSILPFLGALTAPDRVFALQLAQPFIQFLGLTSPKQLLPPLTVMFVAAILASTGIRLLTLWASTRLSFAAGADFSMEVFQRTLYQPYSVHVNRNSSEIINGVTTQADAAIHQAIRPMLLMLSSGMMLSTVTLALLAYEPLVTLCLFGGFALIYATIARLTRRSLFTNSHVIASSNARRIKALQESLGGIRDLLIDGSQPTYCAIYQLADVRLRRAQAQNTFISESPRLLLESLGMALIAFLALAMALQQDGLELALPLLGAFALGAQRLLPLLQQVYQSWATLRGASKTVDHVLALLEQPLPRHAIEQSPPPLPYYRDIELRDVGHRYNPGGPWVLRHISFRIPKGSRVGVKGTTGSGKSTLLDIVMGLLSPTTGQVLVDGAPVTPTNQRAWQAHIAHVPQSIYLADASVAENIAFGTPTAQIDLERVREAASRAQIAKTIEALPNGYDTLVGERGVQLSGGQRQRIGIARALYKRADVLVFDEATSALDTKTEAEVMGAIQTLDRELTIFLIAHRLSTLEGCDVTVDLKV